MKNAKLKKLLSVAAVVVIASTLVIGAFAYFTDYATDEVTAIAGTFGIEIDTSTIDIDGTAGILNPGDSYAFDFSIENTKEKSADVYAVVTVEGTPAAGVTATTDSPYKLYADGSATELTKDTTNSTTTKYVYVLDVAQLSGSKEDIENKTAEVSYNFEFGMDLEAKNEWQGSTAKISIEVFAKQHENTSGVSQADWAAAAKADVGA